MIHIKIYPIMYYKIQIINLDGGLPFEQTGGMYPGKVVLRGAERLRGGSESCHPNHEWGDRTWSLPIAREHGDLHVTEAPPITSLRPHS